MAPITLSDDWDPTVEDKMTPQQEAELMAEYRKQSADFPPADQWDLDSVANPIA